MKLLQYSCKRKEFSLVETLFIFCLWYDVIEQIKIFKFQILHCLINLIQIFLFNQSTTFIIYNQNNLKSLFYLSKPNIRICNVFIVPKFSIKPNIPERCISSFLLYFNQKGMSLFFILQ